MLEHEIRCGYSQAPVLQTPKAGTFTPPSPSEGIFAGEGGDEVPTLTICSTGACKYPHLILRSSIFRSLSNVSANFQRDPKFHGLRYSFFRNLTDFRSLNFVTQNFVFEFSYSKESLRVKLEILKWSYEKYNQVEKARVYSFSDHP